MREVQTAVGRGRTTPPPSPSRYSRNSSPPMASTCCGRRCCSRAAAPTGHEPAAEVTIWVDPSSYLPVRLSGRVQLMRGTANQDPGELTMDFRWLPPTSANLKELTAPFPNEFREVSG
jgi:hypothetical protein